MNRKEFLAGLFAMQLSGGWGMQNLAEKHRPHANPAPIGQRKVAGNSSSLSPMLYGPLGHDTNADAWFSSIAQWGAEKWMAYPFSFHPRRDVFKGEAVPFIGDNLPEFQNYIAGHRSLKEEDLLRKQAQLCQMLELDFWYAFPFPLFPSLNREDVQKAMPGLFRNDKLNIYDPALPGILKAQMHAVKRALPNLKGVNIWFAEGAGGLVEITEEDLKRANEWLQPMLQSFAEVTQELEIGGVVFAHHFLLTVSERRDVYRMLAQFPSLAIMEDITWPEEDMQHPFLGYLPAPDCELLFANNPVDLNFLLDTEYTGQGILPSVYPRWWKRNITDSVRSGVSVGMGRVFFWDGGLSDVNFNRLNTYMFVKLCHTPNRNLRDLMTEAAREMFGPKIPAALINILWETEPVMKKIIGIDGIDCLDHSAFPEPEDIDVIYMRKSGAMKGIDDLFEPPGTVLYPKLSGSLDNYKQWRWQDKSVSKPAQTYLAEKREAIEWVNNALQRVERLAQSLNRPHRDLFIHGYRLLSILARGMELFTETAYVHFEWAHAKTIDDAQASTQFNHLAAEFESLANEVPENPFYYRRRFLAFATFLRSDLPRLSHVVGLEKEHPVPSR